MSEPFLLAAEAQLSISMKIFDFVHQKGRSEPQVADFCCPLSNKIFEDPVTAEDDFNYERKEIQKWLVDNKVSLTTKKPMGNRLKENKKLKEAIQRLKEAGEA